MTEDSDNRAVQRLAGAGGRPPACDLLVITATLSLSSATATAATAADDLLVDTLVRRDPGTGAPMIAAPTLAGVLRHRVTELAGEGAAETLFGTTTRQAALRPHDALAAVATATEIRTGNTVDPARRTVHPGAVFTDEALPAGTELSLLWELWLPGDDPERARHLQELTLLAGTVLEQGLVRVGRRTNAGWGGIRAGGWAARWFALTAREQDRFAWYRIPYPRKAELTSGPVHDSLLAALHPRAAGAPNAALRAPLTAPSVDLPDHLTLTATIHIDETLDDHILAATTALADTSSTALWDSGPALKASLRAAAYRAVEYIATGAGSGPAVWDVRAARERARALVLDLFGPHPADPPPTTDTDTGTARPRRAPAAARIAVDEAVFEGATPVSLPRTAINPLLRAPISGRLGSVSMACGGQRRVRITVRALTAVDRGLMVLITKDFRDGLLPMTGPHRRRVDAATLHWIHTPADGDTAPREHHGWAALAGDEGLRNDVAALVNRIREVSP